MVNTIIGVGITYGVIYLIVSVFFAVIGMFILGYFFNKWTGVFKVLISVILAIIACVAGIVSLFTTAICLINFAIMALSFIAGSGGQIGQEFVQGTITAFIIDIISITTIIVSAKIFFHITMTKEERQMVWREAKKQIWA